MSVVGKHASIFLAALVAASCWSISNGRAQSDPSQSIEVVTVTAQKREEKINTVPMAITAFSADELKSKGVVNTADLAKIVPGFSYGNALYGTPVYTLRGVGFSDTSIAASSGVALNVDEIPLPFAVEAGIAPIDIDHVEVLKGPQGTLFGQNSTGGAINYISAKPTDIVEGGLDASYARFDDVSLNGYISGPLSDKVATRLALFSETSGDWQYNYTRNQTIGAKRKFAAKSLWDLEPSDQLSIIISASYWSDKSDQQAPQYIGLRPNDVKAAKTPLPTEPIAPADALAADWSPVHDPKKDEKFYQFATRINYDISDDLNLISVTAYQNYNEKNFDDADGTQFEALDFFQSGHIESEYQELRLSGSGDNYNWIVGGNYEHDVVHEALDYYFSQSTTALAFAPVLVYGHLYAPERHEINTGAAFVSGEYKVADALRLQGAIRYTAVKQDFGTCTRDPGDGQAAAAFMQLQRLLNAPVITPILPGGCVTLNSLKQPAFTRLSMLQDNVSWRAAAVWDVKPGSIAYVSVSSGYKSGGYPLSIAAEAGSYGSMSQEKLIDYEAGVKLLMMNNTLQVNAAGFHYDYSDKQLKGKRIDPVFGPLNAFVNVPKSQIDGGEIQIEWLPIQGMTLSAAATYLHSEVTSNFINYDVFGNVVNFKGEAFPATPKWSWDIDAQYRHCIFDGFDALIGVHLNHIDSSPAVLGGTPYFFIPNRTLLDARVSLLPQSSTWKLMFWGKNLTNKYYWTDRGTSQDVIFQNAGMPRTYGVTISYSWL